MATVYEERNDKLDNIQNAIDNLSVSHYVKEIIDNLLNRYAKLIDNNSESNFYYDNWENLSEILQTLKEINENLNGTVSDYYHNKLKKDYTSYNPWLLAIAERLEKLRYEQRPERHEAIGVLLKLYGCKFNSERFGGGGKEDVSHHYTQLNGEDFYDTVNNIIKEYYDLCEEIDTVLENTDGRNGFNEEHNMNASEFNDALRDSDLEEKIETLEELISTLDELIGILELDRNHNDYV